MNVFSNLENIEKLIGKKNLLIDEAERIMQHNFDLLGSGLVNVNYGLNPKGVEGIIFKDVIKNVPLNNISNKNYQPINWTIDFSQVINGIINYSMMKFFHRESLKVWILKFHGNFQDANISSPTCNCI